MKYCDERLTKIQVPHDFNRAVKGLSQVKQWKGLFILPCMHTCTHCIFLCIYKYTMTTCSFSPPSFRISLMATILLPPVLHGILPDPYFTHYALLVAAMHVFLSAHISESDFRRAELCLQRFYEIFADMYGEFHAYACNIVKEASILYCNVCTCMQVRINVHIGIQE